MYYQCQLCCCWCLPGKSVGFSWYHTKLFTAAVTVFQFECHFHAQSCSYYRNPYTVGLMSRCTTELSSLILPLQVARTGWRGRPNRLHQSAASACIEVTALQFSVFPCPVSCLSCLIYFYVSFIPYLWISIYLFQSILFPLPAHSYISFVFDLAQ